MVFYGKKFQNGQKIAKLERTLNLMRSQIRSRQRNPLKTIKTEINLPLIGSLLYEYINSLQYVSGCIATYFKREWYVPFRTSIRPLEVQYNKLPLILTQWKYDKLKKSSRAQDRLIINCLLTSAVCLYNLNRNPSKIWTTIGRTVFSFHAFTFVLFPEFNSNWINFIDSFQ